MCENNHGHCHNFCPIDVAKGLCRLSTQIVMIDSPVCSEFREMPRCVHCRYFEGETSPGQCHGLVKPYWVDGNSRAGLCDTFERR
ncbi:4-hydroxyphenylacetate decarboxylase small subunit [Yersinia enterocolitica]